AEGRRREVARQYSHRKLSRRGVRLGVGKGVWRCTSRVIGGSDMKAHIVAAVICALSLGSGPAVAQNGSDPTKPIRPGAVRVTTKAPEPDKWDAQPSANGAQRLFRCKPLACSDPQTVSFIFSRSPTKHPDPKALEKFAKVDLPKSIRAAAAAR